MRSLWEQYVALKYKKKEATDQIEQLKQEAFAQESLGPKGLDSHNIVLLEMVDALDSINNTLNNVQKELSLHITGNLEDVVEPVITNENFQSINLKYWQDIGNEEISKNVFDIIENYYLKLSVVEIAQKGFNKTVDLKDIPIIKINNKQRKREAIKKAGFLIGQYDRTIKTLKAQLEHRDTLYDLESVIKLSPNQYSAEEKLSLQKDLFNINNAIKDTYKDHKVVSSELKMRIDFFNVAKVRSEKIFLYGENEISFARPKTIIDRIQDLPDQEQGIAEDENVSKMNKDNSKEDLKQLQLRR